MSRWRKRSLMIGAALTVLAASGFAYYKHKYPYGHSHCCDKQLYLALFVYADRHDGWFPRGEATPEASLSLLHRDDPESVNAYLLRGKTVPKAMVEQRLAAGELLTPETCGWHYVEGLRSDDDSRLALFWDKAGLGHNGERLSGVRYICRISGIDYVPAAEWEDFLKEQAELRAALKRPK
jgi:hypothetical protein